MLKALGLYGIIKKSKTRKRNFMKIMIFKIVY